MSALARLTRPFVYTGGMMLIDGHRYILPDDTPCTAVHTSSGAWRFDADDGQPLFITDRGVLFRLEYHADADAYRVVPTDLTVEDLSMNNEQQESIKNLMLEGGVSEEEAQRLYAVLERNDWCVLESGADLIIAVASDLHQPAVTRFPTWANLVAWLQQQK